MDYPAGGSVTELSTAERLPAGDLIAELKARAAADGPDATTWPGLTLVRHDATRDNEIPDDEARGEPGQAGS
jgi:hypothetical protein